MQRVTDLADPRRCKGAKPGWPVPERRRGRVGLLPRPRRREPGTRSTPEAVPLDQGPGSRRGWPSLRRPTGSRRCGTRWSIALGHVGTAAEPGHRSDAEFLAAFPQVEKFLKTARRSQEVQLLPGTEVRRDALAGRRRSRLVQEIIEIIVDELEGIPDYEQIVDRIIDADRGRRSNTRATLKPTPNESRLVRSLRHPSGNVQREPLRRLLGGRSSTATTSGRIANIHTMVNSSREVNDVPVSEKPVHPRRDQGR